jgi:hypothetical protein
VSTKFLGDEVLKKISTVGADALPQGGSSGDSETAQQDPDVKIEELEPVGRCMLRQGNLGIGADRDPNQQLRRLEPVKGPSHPFVAAEVRREFTEDELSGCPVLLRMQLPCRLPEDQPDGVGVLPARIPGEVALVPHDQIASFDGRSSDERELPQDRPRITAGLKHGGKLAVLPLEIEVVNASPGITVVSPSKLAQRPGLANLAGAFEDQRLAGASLSTAEVNAE